MSEISKIKSAKQIKRYALKYAVRKIITNHPQNWKVIVKTKYELGPRKAREITDFQLSELLPYMEN